jgi:hypothetical protein
MSITPERWLANQVEAAGMIADKERQECRWLAPDSYAWERPEEDINVLMDDRVFEGFIGTFGATFSPAQTNAATALHDAVNAYSEASPRFQNPAEVLADPRWHDIRLKARAFIEEFEGRWGPKETQT